MEKFIDAAWRQVFNLGGLLAQTAVFIALTIGFFWLVYQPYDFWKSWKNRKSLGKIQQ